MPPKKVLTEREKQILANKNDMALRHVRNVTEEIDPDENIPDSGKLRLDSICLCLSSFYTAL